MFFFFSKERHCKTRRFYQIFSIHKNPIDNTLSAIKKAKIFRTRRICDVCNLFISKKYVYNIVKSLKFIGIVATFGIKFSSPNCNAQILD